jgi:competence ComEA-like helix-hairpin-helix protein
MGFKETVGDYFSFTRKERIAILVILFLLLAIFFLPKFIPGRQSAKTSGNDTSWITALIKLEQKQGQNENKDPSNDYSPSYYQYDLTENNYFTNKSAVLFYFDPNTLSPEGWEKLGIRQKTIRTIQNYLSKGGRFRKPEDVKKIYGLLPDEYERIAPYLRITDDNDRESTTKTPPGENRPAPVSKPRYAIIDINTADTTAFISLPGIGSKLATRIVNFRDKLGGFYSINQVGETFGLPDSTFQSIKHFLKLENVSVREMNINTATVDELKAHPYIRYSLANPIVAYRTEHGTFGKVEDIKKVMAVTEEIYKKIEPYLRVQ